MDPLSISASILAVVTASIQSTKSLSATVKRYKDRDKTLNRLQHELDDLITVLDSLKEAADSDKAVSTLLKGPLNRCSQICREFEDAMEKFSGKTKTGLRDWTKMEFMRGDIHDFMDTLASYKSTIMVGLGTITIEMIKDTAYDLQVRLQRIEASLGAESTSSDTNIDLQDEREVTRQCLRICQDAQSYLKSLQDGQAFRKREVASSSAGTVQSQFEAELVMNEAINESRRNLIRTITQLQERLTYVTLNEGAERERQVSRLREDISISKQCLELCQIATDQVHHHRKIHTIGEVAADDDTDQVVITTLADLFDVRKVLAKNRSAQLVGSMTDETLQKVSRDRYSSRFGAVTGDLGHVRTDTAVPASDNGVRERSTRRPDPVTRQRQPASAEMRYSSPSPNEARKRAGEGEGDI
ncbi:hypothetical protein C7999DRAFT_14611 [Corynascus novoguineensis]|uniref:Azaphilone pigments biosynthesis cluster protein L N-terminal domain-containing protein n=1 Tax=Corynascus novoguineensis TaxID=1126955 RepID=A0AAN7CS84_9PEZI|nr:hypothetical protein C7999DRAFT_14611 [Corynascus novoguineensis]